MNQNYDIFIFTQPVHGPNESDFHEYLATPKLKIQDTRLFVLVEGDDRLRGHHVRTRDLMIYYSFVWRCSELILLS